MRSITFILVLFLLVSHKEIGENKLKISCDQELVLSDFKLELKTPSHKASFPIYENGIFFPILSSHGLNTWLLSYRDSVCSRIGHFKTNANDLHDYSFHFFTKRGRIYCRINILGESELSQKVMLKVNGCRTRETKK